MTDDVAIRVCGLGKRYRIGERTDAFRTLRDTLAGLTRSAFDREARRKRGTIWALHDVDLEVRRGEVLGVIGRNGAGKTTLLKVMSRITEPTEGRVELWGRVGSLLEVGTGFHPELTGRENVYLNGAILGMRRREIDRNFDAIVAFAEVEQFLDTAVKHYSTGMYLRLAFAVAAHLEPEILLVDEVLAVGDAAFQKKCLGRMDEVARVGRTVLFVSHNMGAVTSLCQRAVWLREGRLEADGPADQVVADYLTEPAGKPALELARHRIGGLGQEVRLVAARLLSANEATVAFGEALRFGLEVAGDQPFDGLSLGCSVFSVSGSCIGTLFTRECFSVGPQERTELELRIENLSLAPGRYTAGFSIGTGGGDSGRHDLDIVIGVPAFEILPIAAGGRKISGWHKNWGSIVMSDHELVVKGSGPR